MKTIFLYYLIFKIKHDKGNIFKVNAILFNLLAIMRLYEYFASRASVLRSRGLQVERECARAQSIRSRFDRTVFSFEVRIFVEYASCGPDGAQDTKVCLVEARRRYEEHLARRWEGSSTCGG